MSDYDWTFEIARRLDLEKAFIETEFGSDFEIVQVQDGTEWDVRTAHCNIEFGGTPALRARLSDGHADSRLVLEDYGDDAYGEVSL